MNKTINTLLLFLILLQITTALPIATTTSNITIPLTCQENTTCNNWTNWTTCTTNTQTRTRTCQTTNQNSTCNNNNTYNQTETTNCGTRSGGSYRCTPNWQCQTKTTITGCYTICEDKRCNFKNTTTTTTCPTTTPKINYSNILIPRRTTPETTINETPTLNTTEQTPTAENQTNTTTQTNWSRQLSSTDIFIILIIILFTLFLLMYQNKKRKTNSYDKTYENSYDRTYEKTPDQKLNTIIPIVIKQLQNGRDIEDILDELHKKGWNQYQLNNLCEWLQKNKYT